MLKGYLHAHTSGCHRYIKAINFLSAVPQDSQDSPVSHAKATSEENCETIPTEIHVTKEQYDEYGRLERTCSGDVEVNKCEGVCESQVQPSIVTPTGFLKECFCCRENFLRERIVTLTHCYDGDGVRLTEDALATMDVRLREPAQCQCYKCGDFSR